MRTPLMSAFDRPPSMSGRLSWHGDPTPLAAAGQAAAPATPVPRRRRCHSRLEQPLTLAQLRELAEDPLAHVGALLPGQGLGVEARSLHLDPLGRPAEALVEPQLHD